MTTESEKDSTLESTEVVENKNNDTEETGTPDQVQAREELEQMLQEQSTNAFPTETTEDETEEDTESNANSNTDNAENSLESSEDEANESIETESEESSEVKEESNLSDRQIRYAKEMGYTDDEISQVDGLSIEIAHRKYSQQMSKLGKQQQISDLELSDDETVETFLPKMKTLLDQVKTISSRMDREEREKTVNVIDTFFNDLVKDNNSLTEVFGNGKMTSLSSDSLQATARNEVLEEAKAIKAGYEKMGKNISFPDALERAYYSTQRQNVLKNKNNAKPINKIKVKSQLKPQLRGNNIRPSATTEDARVKEMFQQWEENSGEKLSS